jgi:hypothetical protein
MNNELTLDAKIAFVIGNGPSRENFDLTTLKHKGTIIGCNALYREFTPDVLIGIDKPIVYEIRDTGYQNKNYFLIPSRRRDLTVPESVYHFDFKKYNCAGVCAMRYAASLNFDQTYLLGFDIGGFSIYDGTPCYKKRLTKGWNEFLKGYEWVIEDNPNMNFIVVHDSDNPIENIINNVITYKKFNKIIKNLPYQEPLIAHRLLKIDTQGNFIRADKPHKKVKKY